MPAWPTTVAELLAGRADDDGTGLLAGDDSWTWREVVERSTAVAALARRSTGVPARSTSACCSTTRPTYLFALFGAALAGAAVVGINNTRRGEELARDIRHTDCQLVLTDAEHWRRCSTGSTSVAYRVVRRPSTATRVAGRSTPCRASTLAPPVLRPDDLFVLIFTSGSTGAPKAVQHDPRSGRAAWRARSTWLGRDDVLYCAMPLFHGNALNAIVFPALATGAADRPAAPGSRRRSSCPTSAATAPPSSAPSAGRSSYVLATPESPDDRDHRVKFALAPESSPRRHAGVPGAVRHPLLRRLRLERERDHHGAGAGHAEGRARRAPGGHRRRRRRSRDPARSCPRPAFDDDGRLLNAGEAIGEIVGRNVVDRFEGYYNNPEADAERTRNGWYWSGDLGYRDDDGVFYFAGRAGDWLRVDAENFATAPVERILARFPPAPRRRRSTRCPTSGPPTTR